MTQDKNSLIEQMNLINNCIDDECQEYLYSEPLNNQKIFTKIRNASMLLYNNAMRLCRGQEGMIKSNDTPLTLEKIKDLMSKIYQIVCATDFPYEKEYRIKEIIEREFCINSDILLQETPTLEEEYGRITAVLDSY